MRVPNIENPPDMIGRSQEAVPVRTTLTAARGRVRHLGATSTWLEHGVALGLQHIEVNQHGRQTSGRFPPFRPASWAPSNFERTTNQARNISLFMTLGASQISPAIFFFLLLAILFLLDPFRFVKFAEVSWLIRLGQQLEEEYVTDFALSSFQPVGLRGRGKHLGQDRSQTNWKPGKPGRPM